MTEYKILFCATYPNQPIGYGRIANKISNFLASFSNIKLYYFGFSNYQHMSINRYIHPNIEFIDVIKEVKDRNFENIFGDEIICEFMEKIKPNVLFIYNDIIVTCRLFNSLITYRKNNDYKSIVYLDLVYDYERYEFIRHVDMNTDNIFVFSDYWKNNLIDMGIRSDKIEVFNHGFDFDVFYPINKINAKKYFGFKEDDFIILNTNRNSYRKALDITIDSFLKFLSINSDRVNSKIKLFLNCIKNAESGYNLLSLIETLCIKHKLNYNKIITENIFILKKSSYEEDSVINVMYNCADLGINTCVGEGFGLCNLENAGVGVPQIVSQVGGLKDIFNNEYSVTIKPKVFLTVSNHTDEHNGELKICDSNDFVYHINDYYRNRGKLKEHSEKIRENILSRFKWSDIFEKFEKDFFNCISKKDPYIEYINFLTYQQKLELHDMNFKNNSKYTNFYEIVETDIGLIYFQDMNNKIDVRIFNKFVEISTYCDSVGKPAKADYFCKLDNKMKIITISPENFKYLKQSIKILEYIKSLNLNSVNIIQLGGDYGGLGLYLQNLCDIFNLEINSYIIYDIEEVCEFVKKVGFIKNLLTFSNFEKLQYDQSNFLITNHPRIQSIKNIENNVIKFCDHGFFISEMKDFNKTLIDKIVKTEDEYPKTVKNNKYIYF